MGKPLMLLFSLTVIIILGGSTQVKRKNSKGFKLEANLEETKQDTLLEWMTFMKNESRRFLNEGDLDRSLNYLTRCIDLRWREPSSIEEYEKLAWVYTNRAYLYEAELGDFLAAKDDYLSALEQFESCEPSEFFVARFVYQPLGNIYTRLGENELALSMLENFRRVSEENSEIQALMNAHNDIGRAFVNLSQLDTAIAVMEKGIELDVSDDFSLCLLYSSKAEAEEENGMLEQSLISSKKCIYHVNRVVSSTDSLDYHHNAAKRYKIEALKAKAKVFGHTGRLIEANKICEDVVSLISEIYPEKHRENSRGLVEFGNSYDALGMKIKAMTCYQLSLQSMVGSISTDGFSENPKKSELYADVTLGEALVQKASVAHKIFRKTGEKSWLQISAQAYLTYFDWVEIQRSEQFEFNSKLETANETHKIGDSALESMYDLYEVTKEHKWIDMAFVLMDQTKAIVLAEKRGLKDLWNKNPRIQSLLNEQSALKAQRTYFIDDIREAESSDKPQDVLRLKKRLSELDKQSQLLDQEIKSALPSYRTQSSAKLEAEILKRINGKLNARAASILSYFVGEDWVYVISGSPGSFEFDRFEHEELTKYTCAFLRELSDPNCSLPEQYGCSAKLLYDLLIGDKSKKLNPNWVIFPDGILNSLPFEALVSEESKCPQSFKKMKYVLRDHVINYSPSAYFFAHNSLGDKAKESFLGIAPVFENSTEYSFLPKSLEELQSGSSLFSGEELTEEKATKKQFFKNAERYDILHISTHAGSNSGVNNNAWMVFSDAKSKDHRMIATELLKLDLSASLVVLNACETGSGTVFKGEGPMSLARGFLDAGSQSTVTNLWSVNHESNAVIMKSFYENLSETQSPSRSLNAAKMDYLSNEEIDEAGAHPYFWSSAILVGTDVSVVAPDAKSVSYWIWVLLGLALLLIIGFFWFMKKNKVVPHSEH